MATQRLQKPSKDALALSDCFILMKTTYDLDRKLIRELTAMDKEKFEEIEKEIMELEPGQAFIYFPHELIKVEFKFPNSLKEIKVNKTKEEENKESIETIEKESNKENKKETEEIKEKVEEKEEIKSEIIKRLLKGDKNE